MEWNIKKFEMLTNKELYDILEQRIAIFIVEQDCSYQDCDYKDQESYHLICKEDEKVVAYLRIIPCGISYDEASIGRVIVRQEYRRLGLAREAILKAISFIQEEFHENSIRISGQNYLMDFYQSLGFEIVSDIYLEDGIEHREMLYTKA